MFFGMAIATLLTLFIIPCFYILLHDVLGGKWAKPVFNRLDRQVAILKAAPQRLRPIMMTTVTTILGLFPLALGIGEGSEFLQPLGIVVFFGMAIATLLTLFIIPCFYIVLHDLLDLKWAKPMFNRLDKLRKW